MDYLLIEHINLLYVDLRVALTEDIEKRLDEIRVMIGVKQGCSLSP
jgi:hypothetical protein